MRFVILVGLMLCLGLLACGRRTVVVVDREKAVQVEESGWKALGKRTVHGRNDRDAIRVTAGEGRFTRIQFRVTGSALEMHNVVVQFGDGSRFSPDTRLVFPKGGASRVIDLPGGARVIREITFRYGNIRGGGRAQVRVFGK